VTDEQVRADAHDLPADKQLEQVVRDDDVQHGAREQRQDDVEPREALVAVHVAERVDVDAQRNDRDDDEHDAGEPVHVLTELHPKRSDAEPRDRALRRRATPREMAEDAERQDEARGHRRDAVDRALARRPLAEGERQDRRGERKDRDDPRERREAAPLHADGGYHLRRFTSSTLIVSRLR
jgi:hypothetical protein